MAPGGPLNSSDPVISFWGLFHTKFIHGHGQTLRGGVRLGEGREGIQQINFNYDWKDVSRGIRKFSQNADHFAWTNTYTQMRGRDFSGRTPYVDTVQGLGKFFCTKPKACMGSPRGGFRGAEPPRTPEKFS